MTDPASHVYQYAYDAAGRLSRVTYPDTRVRTYVYENTTFPLALTGIVDERGIRLATYGYDTAGRANLTEHTGPDSHFTLSYAGDATTAQATTVDGFNTTRIFGFSKVAGALKMTSDQYNLLGTEHHTYDAKRNPLTFTNRPG